LLIPEQFAAPKEFYQREAAPLATMFCIDVSAQALSSGLLHVVIHTITHCLDRLAGGPQARVGIMTFDNTVQFWNIKVR